LKLLGPATAVAAILLAGGVALYQAGFVGLFRVRGTLAVVKPHHGLAYVSPTGVEWPEQTLAAAPRLFEDGRLLGPGGSRLGEIRTLAKGRHRFRRRQHFRRPAWCGPPGTFVGPIAWIDPTDRSRF
jgi:hypothetical protein